MFERWAGLLVLPMVGWTLVSRDRRQMITVGIWCVILAVIFVLSKLYERKWVQQVPNRRVGVLVGFIGVVVVLGGVAYWYVVRRLRPVWNRKLAVAALCVGVLVTTFGITRAIQNRMARQQGRRHR